MARADGPCTPPDILVTAPRTAARTGDSDRAKEMIALGSEVTVRALDAEGPRLRW